MYEDTILTLTAPARLWTRREVLTTPSPVPAHSGVYAWYFQSLPAIVPVGDCGRVDDAVLTYIGISPKAPPRNGRPASSQTLRSRIRYHYRGNAAGSTLRLTLGCVLGEALGISLRRVGSGKRLTFTNDGETALSEWMGRNAFVCWAEHGEPWLVEHEAISALSLPLNLDQNDHHAFHAYLHALRGRVRREARLLPVVDR